MTRKIGVSLRDDLYDWAALQVEEGRAESVSALIADGLEVMAARAVLKSLVTDLVDEMGEPDEESRSWLADALTAADRAHGQHLAAQHGEVA